MSDTQLERELNKLKQLDDATGVNKGYAYKQFFKTYPEYTGIRLADYLGVHNTTISQDMKLTKLPMSVQTKILDGTLIRGHGVLLSKLLGTNSEPLIEAIVEKIIAQGISAYALITKLDGLQASVLNGETTEAKVKTRKRVTSKETTDRKRAVTQKQTAGFYDSVTFIEVADTNARYCRFNPEGNVCNTKLLRSVKKDGTHYFGKCPKCGRVYKNYTACVKASAIKPLEQKTNTGTAKSTLIDIAIAYENIKHNHPKKSFESILKQLGVPRIKLQKALVMREYYPSNVQSWILSGAIAETAAIDLLGLRTYPHNTLLKLSQRIALEKLDTKLTRAVCSLVKAVMDCCVHSGESYTDAEICLMLDSAIYPKKEEKQSVSEIAAAIVAGVRSGLPPFLVVSPTQVYISNTEISSNQCDAANKDCQTLTIFNGDMQLLNSMDAISLVQDISLGKLYLTGVLQMRCTNKFLYEYEHKGLVYFIYADELFDYTKTFYYTCKDSKGNKIIEEA